MSFPKGISITSRFQKRFEKCGFFNLFNYCLHSNDLTHRVNSSIDWLFESRREPSLHAAIVKTSIALEILLIFTDSENLSKSLSDRVSYLLSPIPDERQQLSKIITYFYDIRSAIIHGNRKKLSSINPSIIEVMDRICVLMYLTIASNSQFWTSEQDLRKWFGKLHWGYVMKAIKYPFSRLYLKNIFKLGII